MDTTQRTIQLLLEEADSRFPDRSIKADGFQSHVGSTGLILANLAFNEGQRAVFEWFQEQLTDLFKFEHLEPEPTVEIKEPKVRLSADQYLMNLDNDVHS